MSKRQINYDSDKELTARRLKEAMDNANMTASELAEKSKVSKSSISQYCHAVQSPSNLSATAMAQVLNVNPMWLMGFDVPMIDGFYDDPFSKPFGMFYKRADLDTYTGKYVPPTYEVSSDEYSIIEDYRLVSSECKRIVKSVLATGVELIKEQPFPGQVNILEELEKMKNKKMDE